jgi:serine/threonine-protein kinase
MPSKLVIVFMFLALMRALAQTVVTLAGGNSSGTTSGSTNGVGTAALFNLPYSVAVDTSSGNVIVADYSNHKIRLIYPNRTVITLAGGSLSGTTSGFNNGVGTAARFNNPYGVAVDTSGNVIVAEYSNNKIRLIHPNRTVITLAGGSASGTASGSTNEVGTAALFFNPTGVAVDTSGNVYVADSSNNKIRLIYPNRTVITLAGGNSSGTSTGSINGVGTAALFMSPFGVAVDTSGNVIVADRDNNKIRLIFPNRTVITLAGGDSSGTTPGSTNGVGTAALFKWPNGVAVDTSGNVIVADRDNNKIRLIFPNRTVITLAGGSSPGTTSGSTNGVGTAALFNTPRGVAVDTSGNVIVTDVSNNKIRLIYPFTCSPGTYANFTSRSCVLCLPGSFSNATSAESCSLCPGGAFAKPFGSTSCDVCPDGHYCPAGTSSWARLNCGLGNYCPDGSAEPIPCPILIVPVPYASWASHPLTAQGPAFLMEASVCLNHCFWNFTSGEGMLSKC